MYTVDSMHAACAPEAAFPARHLGPCAVDGALRTATLSMHVEPCTALSVSARWLGGDRATPVARNPGDVQLELFAVRVPHVPSHVQHGRLCCIHLQLNFEESCAVRRLGPDVCGVPAAHLQGGIAVAGDVLRVVVSTQVANRRVGQECSVQVPHILECPAKAIIEGQEPVSGQSTVLPYVVHWIVSDDQALVGILLAEQRPKPGDLSLTVCSVACGARPRLVEGDDAESVLHAEDSRPRAVISLLPPPL
mmetsp:Transcript_5869/g.17613  ORF Transcript_5869/g.17613 Transcript_5869/m.17613 type:complete len:249 (-) Transcript_5869:625-1371(-)